ncbi:condensation domain-containing protein [Streptomyces sp. UH6]|uniref:condensation domain-containing protein n=1 Tax=Streptomyces sp. UH6 TaxID=2748379 RepID=UPI0015D51378|nr:condensation domain-containing protein [Streptomyces sp. UH6]NYV73704.1 acyltransferase papA2 [Streptomyces sp. UH6]
MRVTDIQRCDVRPGLLVEWTLSPETVEAAAGLPEDSRPPAYVQESHIRTARSVREDGLFVPTWVGAAFDVPGSVDLDALQQALHRWTLRHETLRSGFRWDRGTMRRFTLDAGAVRLRREVVGEFTEARELVDHLQDRFDVAADALDWPNFIYAAVVREDRTSVYMAFDHSNVDAYSLHRIPAEVWEFYAAAVDGRTVAQPPAGSYVDFCEAERADADRVDDGHGIVARWREFVARCDGRLPNFPVDLGLDAEGKLPTQKLMQDMLSDAGEAAGFEAFCRPFGGSLVGVLAATAVIVREISGTPVYRTVVPFHTRAKSQWQDSVGWYVGGVPIEVDLSDGAGFEEALRRVRAALRENRRLARMPIARVLHLLGSEFRPRSPDLYSIVSFVDGRPVPGSGRWDELHAYGLLRVSYGDQVCVWVSRVHEGLQFAARYPDTGPALRSMETYLRRLREIVAEVAGSAGAVPGTGAPV